MKYLHHLWSCSSSFFLFLLCIMPTRRHNLSQALLDNTYRSTSSDSSPDSSSSMATTSDQQLYHLATAILDIIRSMDCASVSFTSQLECLNVQNRDPSRMNFYLARIVERRRYLSVLPDEGLRRNRPHDAVITVDPFPTANFGHLVVIFTLDLEVTFEECQTRGGWYIGNGQCIQLSEKHRCRNKVHRKTGRRRCETNFLPLVYHQGDMDMEQQLQCYSNAGPFGTCPQLRTDPGNFPLRCELQQNTRRCQMPEQRVNARCKYYEICDQAVIISGGWNRQTTQQRHGQNVRNVYTMLRDHGFKRPNVKTFFADNGDILVEDDEQSSRNTYPATQKIAIRNHIHALCRVENCVETMVVYLNSPTMNDGTSLLWDADSNGIASEEETYSTSELLEDLQDCSAKRVYVIADQSYSGFLADALTTSNDHHNIAVFTSGGSSEYSWNDELTNQWVHANHTSQCTDSLFESYQDQMTSVPVLSEGSFNAANSTIFGAPCDKLPFYTKHELKANFMGCQNLPMALWLSKFRRNADGKAKS